MKLSHRVTAALVSHDYVKMEVAKSATISAATLRTCVVIVVTTLAIIGTAGYYSRTLALWMLGVEAVFALRGLLRLVGEPVLDLFLTAINYPGSRYDYRDPDAPSLAMGRAIECFFFVGSMLILSPLLYA